MFFLLYTLLFSIPKHVHGQLQDDLLFRRDSDSFKGCIGHLGDQDLQVVTASDQNYSNVTQPFNLKYTFQPKALIIPTSPEEVAQVVGCASQSNFSISARSGGHSYGAYGLAGDVVIDLSKLKKFEVATDGTAVIQTGNLLGDVATGLWEHGKRALPHGSCPYVGTGGHASLGGYGFYSRKAGLLLDNIKEAEVVLANGTIVHASKTTNPDLFYAIRGAGPSFGIVTAWTFQTYPAPPAIVDFQVNFGALTTDQFTSALISYQAFGMTAPPELAIQTVLGPNGNGGVFLSFQGDFYGDMDGFHTAIDDWVQELPDVGRNVKATQLDWIDALVAKDGNLSTTAPDSHDTFYAKSLFTSEPSSNQSISDWVNFMFGKGISSNIGWFGEIDMWGGAIANVPQNETSFSHRNAMFGYQLYSSSPGSVPPYPQDQIDFVNEWWAAIAGNDTTAGAYTNYIDPLLAPDVWPVAYYNGSFDRLTSIKSEVDPYNIFRFGQSIPLSHDSGNTSGAEVNKGKNGDSRRNTISKLSLVLIGGLVSGLLLI